MKISFYRLAFKTHKLLSNHAKIWHTLPHTVIYYRHFVSKYLDINARNARRRVNKNENQSISFSINLNPSQLWIVLWPRTNTHCNLFLSRNQQILTFILFSNPRTPRINVEYRDFCTAFKHLHNFKWNFRNIRHRGSFYNPWVPVWWGCCFFPALLFRTSSDLIKVT